MNINAMREKIIETIEKCGFNLKDFFVGCGAESAYSEIHYNAKKAKEFKAIQFEADTETIAVWDIGRRVELHASLDLYAHNKTWNDIHELEILEIGIRGYEPEKSLVAIMPFLYFGKYLLAVDTQTEDSPRTARQGEESGDIYYLNRKEGGKTEIYTNRYERDRLNRQRAIDIHGYKCKVCGFDFGEKYGEYGKGYIEVHHIKPLSMSGERPVNPETDMVCLCSNCHRMIHHKKYKVLTPDELEQMIKK